MPATNTKYSFSIDRSTLVALKKNAPSLDAISIYHLSAFLFGEQSISGIHLPSFLERFGVKNYQVFLVGSRAHNKFRNNSDWDFNIVPEEPISPDDVFFHSWSGATFRLFHFLHETLPQKFRYSLKTSYRVKTTHASSIRA